MIFTLMNTINTSQIIPINSIERSERCIEYADIVINC